MKKRLSLFLVLIIIVSTFYGCNSNSENLLEKENISSISDIEKVMLDDELSSKCESYKFMYMSGNYQVEGYISVPTKCIENNQSCQVIIYNRGGNNNIGLLKDNTTAEICAGTDKIVLATQYRGTKGSTGKDEFGGADIQDVTALIDICEELSFADMNNLCVAGVSRGGMISYISAKEDNRVKRLIAVSAPTDLAQLYNIRTDMQKLLKDCIGGTPEQLPDEYQNRSAIYWSDKINIPVLIIHSLYDDAVPFEQGLNMSNALKKDYKEVKFVTYEDDVHGFHNEDMQVIKEWLG